MAKIFNKLAALALLGVVAVGTAGCSLGELEMPEWLQQATCDHVYDEEEVLKEATCGQDGKVEKICSDCGATKIVSIPATGEHVWELKGTETVEIGTCNTCGLSLADAETIAFQGEVDTGWYRLDVSEGDKVWDVLDFMGSFYVEVLNITGSVYLSTGYEYDFCFNFDYSDEYVVYTEAYLIHFKVDNYIYFYVDIEEEFSIDVESEDGDFSGRYTAVIQGFKNSTPFNLIEKVVA